MDTWKRILLRAAGVGGGFALVAAVILGIVVWWSGRPAKPKPWNTQAITPAGKNELEIQTTGEVFHLRPKCNLKNNTGKDYRMAESGTFMMVNPDNGGLEKLDDTTWDSTTVVPAGQTVNVKFDIPYNLAEYGETASNLTDINKLTVFADKRMKRIKDLKFFDYVERYEIDCPNSWNDNSDGTNTKVAIVRNAANSSEFRYLICSPRRSRC
jgi:hypothetical protein